mmetsp:Transcript_3918/g.10013  ORF Transcript_3918/g.10013 Transcript_3918/m.10013 type:complete len:221 (-) Transcript_3918:572-1234(-)
MHATRRWHFYAHIVLGEEIRRVQRLEVVVLFPYARVEAHPTGRTLFLLLQDEPCLQLTMVLPAAIVQLCRGVCLQRVSRHVEKYVEEGLEAEFLQMRRLQLGRVHVIARRQVELWVLSSRCVGPRGRERRVEALRRVEVKPQSCEIHAQRQCVQVWVRHPNNLENPKEAVLFPRGAFCLLAQVGWSKRLGRLGRRRHQKGRRWWGNLRSRRLGRRHVWRL